MRAHVGVRDGYVRHLFRDDSTWCPQLKEEIQPEKVLLRHGRFAILRCLKDEGSSCILKVAISVLDHMSTSRSSYLYTWALCGRRQMGIVLPHEDHDQPDSFLLYDKPQTLPGCSDPSYRPMPDFFEPWAQDYARYESNAGYGQTLEDTALWEPWCWRFVNPGLTSSSTPTQTSVTAEGMSASVDPTVQLQPQDYGTKVSQDSYDAQSGVTAPRDDYDPMTFEPWATGYFCRPHTGTPMLQSSEDQCFEPWSIHFVPAEDRSNFACSFHEPLAHHTSAEQSGSLFHRLSSWISAFQSAAPTCWQGLFGSECANHHRSTQHSHFQQKSQEPAASVLISTPARSVVPKLTTRPEVAQIHDDRYGLLQCSTRRQIQISSMIDHCSFVPENRSQMHRQSHDQTGCAAHLKAVRDVPIPPCLTQSASQNRLCVSSCLKPKSEQPSFEGRKAFEPSIRPACRFCTRLV